MMWFSRATIVICRLFPSQNFTACIYAFKKWVQCLGGAETMHWKGTAQQLDHNMTFIHHKCIAWLCSVKSVAMLWFSLNWLCQRYSFDYFSKRLKHFIWKWVWFACMIINVQVEHILKWMVLLEEALFWDKGRWSLVNDLQRAIKGQMFESVQYF